MDNGSQPFETVILDLRDLNLRDLPDMDNPVFRESVARLQEQDDEQPEQYLGFQSAI